jgi:hypothetical protein
MGGLIFLTALGSGLWACMWVSAKLGNLVSSSAWRTTAKTGIFAVLLASPFIDEVIGKFQFESLCRANGIQSVDVSKARGKRVKAEYSERGLVGGTAMPIGVDVISVRNTDTSEVLFQYRNYYAFGGWLMRYTPLSMGSRHAMLFSGNGCGLVLKQAIFDANQITQIN